LSILDAARWWPQSAPLRPKLFHQFVFIGALQVGYGAKAALNQPFLGGRADAENETNRLVGQHRTGFILTERRKAPRLLQVGGDLGQEFVAGQSDRNRNPDIALDLAGES